MTLPGDLAHHGVMEEVIMLFGELLSCSWSFPVGDADISLAMWFVNIGCGTDLVRSSDTLSVSGV